MVDPLNLGLGDPNISSFLAILFNIHSLQLSSTVLEEVADNTCRSAALHTHILLVEHVLLPEYVAVLHGNHPRTQTSHYSAFDKDTVAASWGSAAPQNEGAVDPH
jgi:hypothetical protein